MWQGTPTFQFSHLFWWLICMSVFQDWSDWICNTWNNIHSNCHFHISSRITISACSWGNLVWVICIKSGQFTKGPFCSTMRHTSHQWVSQRKNAMYLVGHQSWHSWLPLQPHALGSGFQISASLRFCRYVVYSQFSWYWYYILQSPIGRCWGAVQGHSGWGTELPQLHIGHHQVHPSDCVSGWGYIWLPCHGFCGHYSCGSPLLHHLCHSELAWYNFAKERWSSKSSLFKKIW